MSGTSGWLYGETDYSSQGVYGCQPVMPSAALAAPTQTMATDNTRGGWRALVDPANPLFWVGVIAVVTFGFAGVAGSVRIGGAKASVDLDRG